MKAVMWYPCLALALAAWLRCESDGGNSPVEVPEILTATIQGFVTNGGAHISGAEVSISGDGTTRTASSGSHGFRFADLPPGSYTLTATRPGFSCEPTRTEVEAGESVTASVDCEWQPGQRGTIVGTITAGGSPVSGVLILIVDNPGASLTDANGAFAFDVPPGTYTVFPMARYTPGTTCDSAQVVVETNRVARAEIVCHPTGRISGLVFWPNGSLISQAQVVVSGPIRREVEVSAPGFVLDGLPPGDYTVTAIAGEGCQSANAAVRVAQDRRVELTCEFFSMVIHGDWLMSLPRFVDDFDGPIPSQEGACPPPLPANEALRAAALDPASGTISISGLDPDLTIVGSVHESEFGDFGTEFNGSGSAVRPNGSSIRTDVIGRFVLSGTVPGQFWADMKREHRDPSGSLICTETYWVEGYKS